MSLILGRMASVSVTLFLSMVLALIMLAGLWFYAPDWLGWVQDGADLLEDAIAAIPIPEQYNNLVRIYASDDKIVLLIFTLIARVLLLFTGGFFTRLFGFSPAVRGAAGFIGRIGSTLSTVFLSFVLAIIMLAVIALAMEGVLHAMLDAADWVEDQLAALPLSGRWRSGVRFAVSDDKILLLFFTLIARILIALVATSAGSAMKSFGGDEAPNAAALRG